MHLGPSSKLQSIVSARLHRHWHQSLHFRLLDLSRQTAPCSAFKHHHLIASILYAPGTTSCLSTSFLQAAQHQRPEGHSPHIRVWTHTHKTSTAFLSTPHPRRSPDHIPASHNVGYRILIRPGSSRPAYCPRSNRRLAIDRSITNISPGEGW